MLRGSLILSLSFLLAVQIIAQIQLPSNQVYTDHSNNIVLIFTTSFKDFMYPPNQWLNIKTTNEDIYVMTTNGFNYTESYDAIIDGNDYKLFFTRLPIISIKTQSEILDEPKSYAQLSYIDHEQYFESDIGIELRGGFSQTYPKKTYDIELWHDFTGTENLSHQFGQLRKDDDWILDAMYNEPLRLRSKVAHQLWLDLYSPYYLDLETNAKSGADVMYVELWKDSTYNGIYMLSEQIDKKQLKLKDTDQEIQGQLYKSFHWGNSLLYQLPPFDNSSRIWDSFEIKYPDSEDTTDWTQLYGFCDFVINSDETYFKSNIWHEFHKQNNIDYYLYLNLIYASDNTGKNIYTAKYKAGEPYFYVPWDLDGCFGTVWNGDLVWDSKKILTNGMYDRLVALSPDYYNTEIANQWFAYRQSIFSNQNILDRIYRAYQTLLDNNVYERESIVYGNYPFDDEALNYTHDWILNRLQFLDDHFATVIVNVKEDYWQKPQLYPNPATEHLYVPNSRSMNYIIRSTLGQYVSQGVIGSDEQLNVNHLSTGYYFILLDDRVYSFIKN